ncbi:MAG TPA: hypothetical protein VMU19_06115 [Bryobacteraceae bacterium]|nr:hypothetical protein [Bryobacteraceae bacterium]
MLTTPVWRKDGGRGPAAVLVRPAGTPPNVHKRRLAIRDAVGDIGYPVDVIVVRTARFEETKRWIGGVACE